MYYRRCSKLSDVIEKATGKAFSKNSKLEKQIYLSWTDIVGRELAQKATPQDVSFARNEKSKTTLHLCVYDSFAVEISYMEEVIIEKIAMFFGFKSIEKIKITQKPLADNQILIKKGIDKNRNLNILNGDEAKISDFVESSVEDRGLRDALNKLYRSLEE